jgi:hypothetical protein
LVKPRYRRFTLEQILKSKFRAAEQVANAFDPGGARVGGKSPEGHGERDRPGRARCQESSIKQRLSTPAPAKSHPRTEVSEGCRFLPDPSDSCGTVAKRPHIPANPVLDLGRKLAAFGKGGVMGMLNTRMLNTRVLNTKALLAGALCSLLAIATASAADLKLKAPPPPPPAPAVDAVPMFGDFQLIDSDTAIRRGAFKIQENESPRPMDRVYFNYNYYSGVDTGSQKVNVKRETIGFEKTFLDGNASIGVRLPFFQNLDAKDDTGDVTLIGKYAFYNDRKTGDVISAGVAITPPTGNFSLGFDITQAEKIHSTIVQPFVGGQWALGNGGLFVQGFSSLAIPTDDRDATFWFNSIGIGDNLYHGGPANQVITGIIPTVELHANTPTNHQNDGTPVKLDTIVDFTGGVHIEIHHIALVGLAIGTPLTGPKPYSAEGIASFNLRF